MGKKSKLGENVLRNLHLKFANSYIFLKVQFKVKERINTYYVFFASFFRMLQQLSGRTFVLHARGPQIEPPSCQKSFLNFFISFGTFQGSNPGQKCHFSSGFQRLWDLLLCLRLIESFRANLKRSSAKQRKLV